MNTEKYPWLLDLESEKAHTAIEKARIEYLETGATVFHEFLSNEVLRSCVKDAKQQEDAAFTTDDSHTAYLKPESDEFPLRSVYNHQMRTRVASIAFDELAPDSELSDIYRNPILLELVQRIVEKKLYLSADPLGCCSINVFRPGMHHSFHFDESDFSTTLMLQQAQAGGLFQYTYPLRSSKTELALEKVAAVISKYDEHTEPTPFSELHPTLPVSTVPTLHTLDFRPGTLSIFCGSQSLHRVTMVEGASSRLVAVLTFASEHNFCNSAKVQQLFWGRSKQPADEQE
jgi:hypothetical protein